MSKRDEIFEQMTSKEHAMIIRNEDDLLKKEQDNSILQEAHRIVNERVRESDRDNPIRGFVHIASIASTIRGKDITPRDATAIMMAVKLSREQFKHNRDNLVDLAGYTQIDHLLAEAGYE